MSPILLLQEQLAKIGEHGEDLHRNHPNGIGAEIEHSQIGQSAQLTRNCRDAVVEQVEMSEASDCT